MAPKVWRRCHDIQSKIQDAVAKFPEDDTLSEIDGLWEEAWEGLHSPAYSMA